MLATLLVLVGIGGFLVLSCLLAFNVMQAHASGEDASAAPRARGRPMIREAVPAASPTLVTHRPVERVTHRPPPASAGTVMHRVLVLPPDFVLVRTGEAPPDVR